MAPNGLEFVKEVRSLVFPAIWKLCSSNWAVSAARDLKVEVFGLCVCMLFHSFEV